VTGITRQDKIKNDDIRKIHVERLNDIVNITQDRKQISQIADYKLQEIRSHGQPRKRWEDQT
jgi:hypothetical protein